MTVARLTSNGKVVQIIDDYGRVYQTSTTFMMGLLNGRAKGNFVLLSRCPWNVAPDRFKKSEIWDPNGLWTGDKIKSLDPNSDPLTTTNDGLSVKVREEKKKKKSFEDKAVW